jgi:hypothetical protein
MKPARLTLAAAPLAALTLAASAPALASSAGHVHRVGSCTAQGDYAVCDASGSINHPRNIHIHVSASPDQHVSVYWDVTCSKGTGAGGKHGSFSGTTTLRRAVRMPYARPDSCVVSADAQLSSAGRLRVWITARKQR